MQVGAGATSIVVLVAGGLVAYLFGGLPWIVWAIFGALALIFVFFAMASFALAVRRIHDLGASGWWVALGYGAGLVGILLLFMGIAMTAIARWGGWRLPCATPRSS